MGKARTKGQKREARKRGRPRHAVEVREPNGRASRARRPKEPANAVAIAARVRLFGVAPCQAVNQRAATVVGRLALLGAKDGLSSAQFDAAGKYLAALDAYRRAMGSAGAVYCGGSDPLDPFSDEAVEKTQETIRRFGALAKAVWEAQRAAWPEDLSGALQWSVVEDREPGERLGALRLGLNALARHFRLDDEE